MKDMYNNIEIAQVIDPVVASASVTAVEVDLQGYNSATILAYFGTNAGNLSGTNKWTVELTHADDDGTGSAGAYANVGSDDVLGVTPSSGVILTLDADAEDNTAYKVGYVGGKRFIKIGLTKHASAPNIPVSICVVKGDGELVPAV